MTLWIKLGVLTAVGLACLALLAAQIGQFGGAAGAFADTYSSRSPHFTTPPAWPRATRSAWPACASARSAASTVDRGEAVVAHEDRRTPPTSREARRFELRGRTCSASASSRSSPRPAPRRAARPSAEGALLATAPHAAAADLSMLLNNTEPLVGKLDAGSLNRVMGTLAAAVAGREAVLTQGLDECRDLAGYLTTRRRAIDRSLVNLDTLITGIAERDAEVERFLVAFRRPRPRPWPPTPASSARRRADRVLVDVADRCSRPAPTTSTR